MASKPKVSQKLYNPSELFEGSFVPLWLLRRPDVSEGAKLLYGVLARMAHRNGYANPRQTVIQERLGLGSVDSVQRRIMELVKGKLIRPKRMGLGRANVYFFIAPEEVSNVIEEVELDRENADQDTASGAASGDTASGAVIDTASGAASGDRVTNAASIKKGILERDLGKDAASPPRVIPDGPNPEASQSPHVQFVDGWTKAYVEHYGIAYKFAGAKDGVAAKSLLATGKTPHELLEMAKQCWIRTGFDFQQATTIAGFNSRYNQIATQLLKPNGRRFEAREHQEQVEVPEY